MYTARAPGGPFNPNLPALVAAEVPDNAGWPQLFADVGDNLYVGWTVLGDMYICPLENA